MSPTEFRAARESLGLSAAKMGAVLGVDGRQVRRYEAGTSVIPGPVRVLVKVLVGGGRVAVDLLSGFRRARPKVRPGPTQQGKGEENPKLGEGSCGDGIIYG